MVRYVTLQSFPVLGGERSGSRGRTFELDVSCQHRFQIASKHVRRQGEFASNAMFVNADHALEWIASRRQSIDRSPRTSILRRRADIAVRTRTPSSTTNLAFDCSRSFAELYRDRPEMPTDIRSTTIIAARIAAPLADVAASDLREASAAALSRASFDQRVGSNGLRSIDRHILADTASHPATLPRVRWRGRS